MGYIAENARRFFHPAAINDMLSTFVPNINGTDLNVSLLPTLTPNTLTFYTERPILPVLPPYLPTFDTSTILSSHAPPDVGVHEFLRL